MYSEQGADEGTPVAIRLQAISKCYQIYEKPQHRLWQGLARGRRQFFREFWALRDVSFEVRRGETLGVIGRNGSGKSTLLQIICGTLAPTTGSIAVDGRVGALLELGAGFNPEFTGRENVYLNATVLGLSRRDIDARFAAIAAFADIGEFIDQPVKTYSSGMYVRLGFAVIANIDADILIIDEALAVGDALFTQKCMRFLRDFQRRGTILFVSHDTSAVLNLCERAVLLKQGRVMASGPAKEVVEAYHRSLVEGLQGESLPARRASTDPPSEAPDVQPPDGQWEARVQCRPQAADFGHGLAFIVDAVLFGVARQAIGSVDGGESVRLSVRVRAREAIDGLIVGFHLKDRLGQIIFGENTLHGVSSRVQLAPAQEAVAEFEFRIPHLASGEYTMDLAVAEGTQASHVQHQWFYDAMVVTIYTRRPVFGVMAAPELAIRLRSGKLRSTEDDARGMTPDHSHGVDS
jgi:lipopolysaccharide transport system ATP-binding protein